jgi:hypothetical protein
MRAGVKPFDRACHDRDPAAIRRPARKTEYVRTKLSNYVLDSIPRVRRQIEDLDLVSRAPRLRAERKETVRRLKEVSV